MMLETKDLVLRTVDSGDLEEVARMWDFEKGSISLEKAEQEIDFMKANQERNQRGRIYHLCLAVFEKDKNHIIGWCGLDGRNRRKLDIFYSIDPACRNRGYATQCARRMLRYAFEEAKAPFVNGGCYKENIASYRVMKKAGMEQDGFEENGDPLFLINKTRYCELRQTDEYFFER